MQISFRDLGKKRERRSNPRHYEQGVLCFRRDDTQKRVYFGHNLLPYSRAPPPLLPTFPSPVPLLAHSNPLCLIDPHFASLTRCFVELFGALLHRSFSSLFGARLHNLYRTLALLCIVLLGLYMRFFGVVLLAF